MKPRQLPLLVLAALLTTPPPLHAQDALQQAERELAAAQAKKAQQEAAAREARDRQQSATAAAAREAQQAEAAAAREAQQAQAAAAAAASRMASLLIQTDAACALSINAEASGQLGAGDSKKISVPAGDVLLECVSQDDAAVKYREVKQFTAQQNAVVLIELQRQLAKVAGERQAQAAVDARRNRFVQAGSGVLQDTQSGLYWTQSDNGSDIDWNAARSYCASKGWALPSVDELAAILDTSGAVGTSCAQFTCNVSPLFSLTNVFFWSGTANGSRNAWQVTLDDGDRLSLSLSHASLARALCVRRS